MAASRDEDRQMKRTTPNALGGSALGVFTLSALQMKFQQRAGDTSGSAAEKEDQETDTVNAPKYTDPLMGISYFGSGAISIAESSGEFVFANSGAKPTSGAMYLNQVKSQFTSTAGTTTLGTEQIKTLTGLRLNPAAVRRPSSAMTPDRSWMASLFPSLSRFNVVEWVTVQATQALFWEAMSLLFQEDRGTTDIVHNDRKDLGTLIVDNQDYELMILNGTI